MEKIIEMIKQLIREKFWGILELKFEDGKLVHIRQTKNIKP